MKKGTLIVVCLAVVFCGCDRVLPAKNIKLSDLLDEVERDYIQAAEDWEGKWVRFKGRVEHKSVGDIALYTGRSKVVVSISANPDPASTRFDKYEVGKVHTFRVKIMEIRKTPYLDLWVDTTPAPNEYKLYKSSTSKDP